MKRTRFTLLALALVASILLFVGLVTAVFPQTAHAAPLVTVINLNNSGAGSLRQAIADVDPGGTIEFSVSGTIVLTSELVINKNLTIDGGNVITVSGNNATRVFNVTAGNVTFDSLTIVNGNSPNHGGGIRNDGTLTVTNSTLSGNSANDRGGGIYNTGTLAVTNSTLSGNSANLGGGIRNDVGVTEIINSTLSGNLANYGGGIFSATATGNCTATPATTIRNSTLSGNTVTNNNGGGIYNSVGVTEISNSTIMTNTANSGGGVWSFNDGSTCTRVGGTIIAGNTGSDVAAADTVQRFFSLGHNLIGTAGANVNLTLELNQTGDITNTLPLLGPLADNGGPTLTHTLLPGSPAIDAGNCDSGPVTDQRGVARPQDDSCDIGAFELLTCAAGFYFNGNSCVPAPAGSFVPTDGATSATPCSPGTYQDQQGQTACLPADPGYFVQFSGSIEQTSCPLGMYQDQQGQTACLPAPVNTYVDVEGAIAPIACPAHTYNPLEGSASASACQPAICYATRDSGATLYSSLDAQAVRGAITAADPGDTVKIGGTCAGAVLQSSTTQVALIDKALTLSGGYVPTSTVSFWLQTPDPIANPTTLDAESNGRVLYVAGGNVVILDSLIIVNGNVAGDGGGIYNGNGTLTVNNSTLFNNLAAGGGGILNLGTLTVNNSTLSGNTATFNGGGIQSQTANGDCNATPRTIIRNSTLSGNTVADDGGGIANINGVTEISNSTITANTASSGGGVSSWNYSGACTRVGGTIIAGNTGSDVAAADTVQRFFSLGHNLIGTAGANVDITQEFTATGDMTATLPLLGALADNGGPTLTHMPRVDSPAVNAGNCASGPAADQRGLPRLQDTTCDIGAVEVQSGEDKIQICDLAEGVVYHFGATGVQIEIDTLGGLNCLEIGITNALHISATGTIAAGIQAPYVTITTTPAIASGFQVTMTLLHPGFSNPLICKNPGDMGGAGWDCARDGFNSNRVWRGGIDGFSDWAVGNDVTPTAVTLASLAAAPIPTIPLIALAALFLLLLSGSWLVVSRRR